MIENDKLVVVDSETVTELTTFAASKASFAAEAGSNDDLAMTLVSFGWLSSQKFFKDTIASDIRQVLQEEQMRLMDRDLVPFGIISDGLEPDREQDANGDVWVRDRRNYTPWDDLGHIWNKL